MSPAFARACRAGAALELPVLVAIAPALLFPTPARLLALAVVPPIWWCVQATGGRVVPRTPLDAPLWLMLGMAAVSIWATFDVRFSLGKLSGLALGVLLFWGIVRWLTTRDRLLVAVIAFILAGAALAMLGLLGTNWERKIPLFAAVTAQLPKVIRGLPGAVEGFSPNAVAGCLVLFVPLQAAVLGSRLGFDAVVKGSWSRAFTILQSALVVLTAGTLLLTQSRGAFAGVAVAFAACLLWYSRRTRILTTVALAASVPLALRVGPARLIDLVISEPYPGYAGMASHLSGRMELWSRAVSTIQNFPFAGVGMNGFRKVMPPLYPPFLSPPEVDVVHSHNHLLQAALDLGIPGLIAYLAMWLVVAALLIEVYRRSAKREYRTVAGGLGAGLIAHFVFSMTDAIPLGAKVGVTFWMTLALTVGLHRVMVAPRAEVGVS